MLTSIDPLNPTAHRFTRGTSHVDVIADHPAPSVEEAMRRMEMVKIEGGTSTLTAA